ncbi:MAG: hypothetical protein RSB74_06595, partial [Kiritimatiellia bacterium]
MEVAETFINKIELLNLSDTYAEFASSKNGEFGQRSGAYSFWRGTVRGGAAYPFISRALVIVSTNFKRYCKRFVCAPQ